MNTDNDKDSISVSRSVVVNTMIVTDSDLDQNDYCSGGAVLSWIDVCAGLAAGRVAGNNVVTASVDAVHFLRPTYKSELLIISAMVNRCFKSSMEVGVRVETENLKTGKRRYCCSAYLTFVSINDQGKSVPVRQVVAESKAEQRRFTEALVRRTQRLSPSNIKDALVDPIAVFQNRGVSCAIGSLAGTHTQMVYKIFPQHANSVGVTFGGQIMAWMETAGSVAAARFSRTTGVVLASIDTLSFREPTHTGDTVYITAKVSASYTTSVEVVVSVYKGHHLDLVHCNSAFMTFASIDTDTKQSVDVPKANAATAEEMALVSTGWHRREKRIQHRNKLRRPDNE
eukprot:CFRG7877T1